MNCSLPGSPIHGVSQARILEWVVISFSRRSFWPRDWTLVSCIVGGCFTVWATREVLNIQILQLITKNRHLKLMILVLYYIGRCKSLDLLKLFLWYASQLSRTSILFFSILNSYQGIAMRATGVADGLTVATFLAYGNSRWYFFFHNIISIFQIFLDCYCIFNIHISPNNFLITFSCKYISFLFEFYCIQEYAWDNVFLKIAKMHSSTLYSL